VRKLAQIVRLIAGSLAILVLMISFLSCEAYAEWPERTVKIIVPFARGGATDLLGRLLATQLGQRLGQNVNVENRVGAVGTNGMSAAVRTAANGYTLLVTTNAALITLVMNSNFSKFSYDPIKDFAPIAYLGTTPSVIVTRRASGIGSLADLITKAKGNPGALTYASPGVGSSSHFAMEFFKRRASIDIRHIPFDGSGRALRAVLSGSTDIAIVGIGGLMEQLRSDAIKCLAQTGSERWVELPDVPTMEEAGVPGVVTETSVMFFAPAGTPAPIIERLTQTTRMILQNSNVQADLMKAGFSVRYEEPDVLRARIKREIPMWEEIVERAGVGRMKR